jgi:hypothetical protein
MIEFIYRLDAEFCGQGEEMSFGRSTDRRGMLSIISVTPADRMSAFSSRLSIFNHVSITCTMRTAVRFVGRQTDRSG